MIILVVQMMLELWHGPDLIVVASGHAYTRHTRGTYTIPYTYIVIQI